jgi:hypothetical protein
MFRSQQGTKCSNVIVFDRFEASVKSAVQTRSPGAALTANLVERLLAAAGGKGFCLECIVNRVHAVGIMTAISLAAVATDNS